MVYYCPFCRTAYTEHDGKTCCPWCLKPSSSRFAFRDTEKLEDSLSARRPAFLRKAWLLSLLLSALTGFLIGLIASYFFSRTVTTVIIACVILPSMVLYLRHFSAVGIVEKIHPLCFPVPQAALRARRIRRLLPVLYVTLLVIAMGLYLPELSNRLSVPVPNPSIHIRTPEPTRDPSAPMTDEELLYWVKKLGIQ